MEMSLYGRAVSSDVLASAMMHMRNKQNRTGSFTKRSVETYVQEVCGVPARMQSRDARGRFAHVVSPADRFADRLMQKLVRAGRIEKGQRDGVVTHWKWIAQKR